MTGGPEGQGKAGRRRGGAVAASALLAVALAGCARPEAPQAVAAAQEAPAPDPTLAPGDIPAPEAFHATEPGLWDGRPSLGGLWVAHPDAAQPERVRILNLDTGQSVTGALFRRERDLPGPALQVSSGAAAALGMLAGAPATLDVLALRRATTASSDTPIAGGDIVAASDNAADG
ncbi:hypothetical protein [Rubellimicrobium aerolatum]|uniref:Uncharacterized protein n=1 Tax=Rubellimicrobium aerolatum TaxID=490979 RepID=A0ABW0SDC0_9RHOB|nr:hypothetical protein [Rubellimicrobium aerolatum]